jgi:REP-associated tyrosine transposase
MFYWFRPVTSYMRKPRKVKRDTTYHVTALANLQEYIFANDGIKELFTKTLFQAKDIYGFKLINYVIMDNHIHLLIAPVGEPEILSSIMRWLLGTFAIRFNGRFNRKGHVFYDRFKSKIVHNLDYVYTVFKYIIFNPVKAKLAETIFSYKYSGIYQMMRGDFRLVEKPSRILQHFFPYLRI